eukprot:scaffold23175_cov29-Tisochrysis_lutea.AAC.2
MAADLSRRRHRSQEGEHESTVAAWGLARGLAAPPLAPIPGGMALSRATTTKVNFYSPNLLYARSIGVTRVLESVVMAKSGSVHATVWLRGGGGGKGWDKKKLSVVRAHGREARRAARGGVQPCSVRRHSAPRRAHKPTNQK